MTFFTSARERRLWLWVLCVGLAIFLTLGLAQTLAGVLRMRGLLEAGFWLAILLVGATGVALTFKTRPSGAEIGVGLGIFAVYLLVFIRMAIPEERSHLIEYGVLAIFIYEALQERRNNGKKVPQPALVAIVATALIGWLDEGIQALLPNRVYDLRDVAFNALAGGMAIVGSLALTWARRWGVNG